MMSQSTEKKIQSIAKNRKARHDYTLSTLYEAGIVLEGWEVKSIRAGRSNLKDSHVLIRQGEAWLVNLHISPLSTTNTHRKAEPDRSRKLLLHRIELKRLIGKIKQKGLTLIATELYWRGKHVKVKLALAKGKKKHDKRASIKERDWERSKLRLKKHML